jgi:hypothetical protein
MGGDIVEEAVSGSEVKLGGFGLVEESWQTAVRMDRSRARA